jgi:chromate transporter
MSDLVRLLNVFCLLSLLAVGGGSAVLPEMQHETVARHHWVTDQQFTTIYSLGQMAPGPNMSMVALIGWQVAGVAGLLVVLVAFYLPSSFLVYGCSYIWDHFKENRWRASVQRGMAPITIGLMLAGVHAVGKTACINPTHTLLFNTTACGIALGTAGLLFAKHINPAWLMLLGGIAGWFFLRGG